MIVGQWQRSRAGFECLPSPFANLQIFLPVRASSEQIEARGGISQTPGVTIDRYLDHQDALSQFACIFADNPDVVDSLGAVNLPVSFTVKPLT